MLKNGSANWRSNCPTIAGKKKEAGRIEAENRDVDLMIVTKSRRGPKKSRAATEEGGGEQFYRNSSHGKRGMPGLGAGRL